MAQAVVMEDIAGVEGQELKEVGTSKKRSARKSKLDEPVSKPHWVPDAEATKCHNCQANFSLLLRKHHCRGCGNIFCVKCCDSWLLPPPELDYKTIQRMCQACFKRLSSIDFLRNYDAWGDKHNPAIILIHGACGTRRNWFLLGPALAEKGYFVIAPDMPEHGARCDEKLNINSAIEAVADMIHYYVPSKKAIVFGYSMGGYIAMAFGAKYPELCRGLIIGGAGVDHKKDRSMLEWMGTYYKLLSNKSKTSLEKTWHDTPLIAAKVEEDVLNEYCLRAGSYYDAWPSIVNMLTSENYKKLLMRIHAPVLFFNGQLDKRDAERKWLNCTTNGRLEVIPEAGYMCVIDKRHRDKVKDLIVQFANYAVSLSKDKRHGKKHPLVPRVPKPSKGKEKDATSKKTPTEQVESSEEAAKREASAEEMQSNDEKDTSDVPQE